MRDLVYLGGFALYVAVAANLGAQVDCAKLQTDESTQAQVKAMVDARATIPAGGKATAERLFTRCN